MSIFFSPGHCLVCPTYKILQKVEDATNANVGRILQHLANIETWWQVATCRQHFQLCSRPTQTKLMMILVTTTNSFFFHYILSGEVWWSLTPKIDLFNCLSTLILLFHDEPVWWIHSANFYQSIDKDLYRKGNGQFVLIHTLVFWGQLTKLPYIELLCNESYTILSIIIGWNENRHIEGEYLAECVQFCKCHCCCGGNS